MCRVNSTPCRLGIRDSDRGIHLRQVDPTRCPPAPHTLIQHAYIAMPPSSVQIFRVFQTLVHVANLTHGRLTSPNASTRLIPAAEHLTPPNASNRLIPCRQLLLQFRERLRGVFGEQGVRVLQPGQQVFGNERFAFTRNEYILYFGFDCKADTVLSNLVSTNQDPKNFDLWCH